MWKGNLIVGTNPELVNQSSLCMFLCDVSWWACIVKLTSVTFKIPHHLIKHWICYKTWEKYIFFNMLCVLLQNMFIFLIDLLLGFLSLHLFIALNGIGLHSLVFWNIFCFLCCVWYYWTYLVSEQKIYWNCVLDSVDFLFILRKCNISND